MLHQEQFANDKGNDTAEKEVSEIDNGVVKWPTKTVLLDTDMFEVDDSWHDTPPEGFSLTVSILQKKYLRPILLFANTDVSTTKMCLDTSILAKIIMGRREYQFCCLHYNPFRISLTCISFQLSAFATMWATLFGWISRSSLAYVYMLDESSVEELSISNGREYPEKRVSRDSQSSEIKRALASCISNALPVLVSNLRMRIPVSKLETTLV
jgi:hypothetical protein